MVLNPVDIFLIIGAAQGFILSLLIFQKRSVVKANFYLSLLVGFYSFVLLDLFLNEAGIYKSYPIVQTILIGTSLAVFPFYHLYTKSLAFNFESQLKKEWFHFFPFILYKLFFVVYRVFTPNTNDIFDLPFLILNWLIALQAIIYIAAILIHLKHYSKKIKQVYSEIEKLRLTWLSIITYATIIVIVIYISEFILVQYKVNISQKIFDVSSFFSVVNMYAIGYYGLFKSAVFKEANIGKSFEQIEYGIGTKKYEKSGLSEEKAQMYLEKLVNIMENQKPYTNSNITLTELANLCNIKPHNLSEVLNTKLNQNFFDFINEYRVKEVKKLLQDESNKNFTILGLAFEAGFNSKTSFNTIFKKITQMTPSEYKKSLN